MKPVLATGSVVRNLLNVAVNSWPAKPIDPSKPFQCQDRRPVKGGLSTPISHLQRFSQDDPAAEAWFLHRSGQRTDLRAPHKVGDTLYVRETCARTGVHKEPWTYRTDWTPGEDNFERDFKWTPAIHAPKESSRIHLEVMRVRVERAGDISEEDAIAEGCKSARDFLLLWQSLYGHFSEDKWIWVYELKRIK